MLADLGYPTVTIAYRNDRDAPGGASDVYCYGTTEWRDLEAAVDHALANGARDVVLVGFSMGAGLVVNMLALSERAGAVRGAVLDAPLLDLRGTVEANLRDAGILGFLTWLPLWITERRYGVGFGSIELVDRLGAVRAPVLLFHGSEDDTVSVALSDEIAARLGGLVTYERFEGAHHARSWNVDRARYESAVRAFLGGLAAGR